MKHDIWLTVASATYAALFVAVVLLIVVYLFPGGRP